MQYRDAEGVLARLIGVFPDKRPRFQARLKQLQRMGFPQGINAGKSARAVYRADHLFKLAVVLELLQTGITPERAVGFVGTWWDKIRRGLLAASATEYPTGIAFWPKDFGGFTTNSPSDEDEKVAWPSNGSALFTFDPTDLKDIAGTTLAFVSHPRTVLLNLSHIWSELTDPTSLDADVHAELMADIEEWKHDIDNFGNPIANGNP